MEMYYDEKGVQYYQYVHARALNGPAFINNDKCVRKWLTDDTFGTDDEIDEFDDWIDDDETVTEHQSTTYLSAIADLFWSFV
jgi:hypothetical protein